MRVLVSVDQRLFGVFDGLGGHFFAGADGVDGLEDGAIDLDVDVVVVEDVHFPGLEPLQVDEIADVLLLFFVEDDVPGDEVLDQLLLHLFLCEDVENLPKAAEVKVLLRNFQPVVDLEALLLPQFCQDILVVGHHVFAVGPQKALVALNHQLLVGGI